MADEKEKGITVKTFRGILESLGKHFDDFTLTVKTSRYSDDEQELESVNIDIKKRIITVKG